jgi:hypothetical protein
MEMSARPHAPAALPPGKSPGTHSVGGWVGPSAGLDAEKKKILGPHQESKPRTPVVQPVTSRCTD